MEWRNGRKLNDPGEFQKIKDSYFEPDFITDIPNEELMEQQTRKTTKNQAR